MGASSVAPSRASSPRARATSSCSSSTTRPPTTRRTCSPDSDDPPPARASQPSQPRPVRELPPLPGAVQRRARQVPRRRRLATAGLPRRGGRAPAPHPTAAIASGPGLYVDDDGDRLRGGCDRCVPARAGAGRRRAACPGPLPQRRGDAEQHVAATRSRSKPSAASTNASRRPPTSTCGASCWPRHDLAWMDRPRLLPALPPRQGARLRARPERVDLPGLGGPRAPRDAAGDVTLVRDALDAEAERSLLHAAAHLLAGDLAAARRHHRVHRPARALDARARPLRAAASRTRTRAARSRCSPPHRSARRLRAGAADRPVAFGPSRPELAIYGQAPTARP